MKTIKGMLIGAFITGFLFISVETAAGTNSFKAAIVSAITANFKEPEQKLLTDSFVIVFAGEFKEASKKEDNQKIRTEFAASKINDFVTDVVKIAEGRKAQKLPEQ